MKVVIYSVSKLRVSQSSYKCTRMKEATLTACEQTCTGLLAGEGLVLPRNQTTELEKYVGVTGETLCGSTKLKALYEHVCTLSTLVSKTGNESTA